jgi:hypothetical protein
LPGDWWAQKKTLGPAFSDDITKNFEWLAGQIHIDCFHRLESATRQEPGIPE